MKFALNDFCKSIFSLDESQFLIHSIVSFTCWSAISRCSASKMIRWFGSLVGLVVPILGYLESSMAGKCTCHRKDLYLNYLRIGRRFELFMFLKHLLPPDRIGP